MFFGNEYEYELASTSTSWTMDFNNLFIGPSSSASHLNFPIFPPETHPPSQTNSEVLNRIFGHHEPAAAVVPSTSSAKSDISIEACISKELPDYECYEHFDKLWIASKYHVPLLNSQWECLMGKVRNQEALHTLRLTTGAHVTSLFHLCRELETNFVVRFRALELYERYLLLFSEKMGDYVKSCTEENMDIFFQRYESQIMLRMCTCILIASKLHTDTQLKALRSENIQEFLIDQGLKYSCKSISSSELRVLETLNYRCHWVTPLDVIEQLLCLLALTLPIFQRTHYFCILLLEYCYSDWDKIRDQWCALPQRSSLNNQITIPLQCAAIVSAGLFIVAAESKENDLHKRVAQVAQLPEEDVHDLAIIILNLLNGSS